MPSTAQLIKKEKEALQKTKAMHEARLKKLEENGFKRVMKVLKQANFFEADFSDAELQEGIKRMIAWKKNKAPQKEETVVSKGASFFQNR